MSETKFSAGDKVTCIKSSRFDYGPDVKAGEEYVLLSDQRSGPNGEDVVMPVGLGGYSFPVSLFTKEEVKRMILGTTTYSEAVVPWSEVIDPDASWEKWGWGPCDRRPEHRVWPGWQGW